MPCPEGHGGEPSVLSAMRRTVATFSRIPLPMADHNPGALHPARHLLQKGDREAKRGLHGLPKVGSVEPISPAKIHASRGVGEAAHEHAVTGEPSLCQMRRALLQLAEHRHDPALDALTLQDDERWLEDPYRRLEVFQTVTPHGLG